MAVVVKKLEGNEVPEPNRVAGDKVVYRVTDGSGMEHLCLDDIEAARLAVDLSADSESQRA